jgi:hypothetical protein
MGVFVRGRTYEPFIKRARYRRSLISETHDYRFGKGGGDRVFANFYQIYC